MEKFNEIRNKFEQGFTPTEEEISTAFNATDHVDTKNLTQQTPRKRSHLNRSTRKKKPRRVRAKQLEVLPSIYENLSENFSKLDLSQHEYENIQAVALEPTEYFLPDSTSATNLLDQNELLAHKDSAEDYEEFVINNELYESFFQRIGESPTDYFASSNTMPTFQPLDKKTFPTAKENFSEIQTSTTNSVSDSVVAKNKFRKLKKNQATPPLVSQEENEEPLFGDITKINPDGTIEWQTWYPPTAQSDLLKSKQSGLKLSKFLPDKICFWRAPDTADSEEKKSRLSQLRK